MVSIFRLWKGMVMSMDFGGVSSVYADYMTSQASGNKASNLQNKLQNGEISSDEKELKEACKEFEAYFVEQMFDAMLKTTEVFSDKKDDGYATKMVDYFKDFAVQELCDQVTDGQGVGLANTLYEQMKRNYGIGAIKPEDVEKIQQES